MTFLIAGCADYYGPAYGPYYSGGGYYRSPGYGYAGYPGYGNPYYGTGAVVVDVNDRPYYTRGTGYYVGRAYYVWVPGHWNRSHTRWIHGHYVLRG